MPTISIYLEDETQKKAEQMTRIEERSMSNFIALLINHEWRRNFQAAELKRILPDGSLNTSIQAESIPEA
jgi:predicted transcriptional regulator